MAVIHSNEGEVSADINITPLADVMLVLLIIFMITAPMSTPAVKITLPETVLKHQAPPKPVVPIDLAIKSDGSMYWGAEEVTMPELRAKLAVAAQKDPQPPLQIRAARTLRYEVIKKVLATAKGAGMVHMEFVTNDVPKHGG
ncbi:MAG TPA: biopolymer transporter ExbD [Rhodanobacteraceae bacterium]